MKLHPGIREVDVDVVLEFGGSSTHPDDRALVMRVLHDRLITHFPRRLGPVEWRFYAPEYAEEALTRAHLLDHPNAAGLVAFLKEAPDVELVIASVAIPRAQA